MKDFNKRLKQFRQQKGLTQKELGDLLEVSEAMVGQYERGVRNPKLETINKIAAALEISTFKLMGLDLSDIPTEDLLYEINRRCGELACFNFCLLNQELNI